VREARERHLQVVRTARYWVLGAESPAPAEVWFVLHGYGQLARRFLRRFRPLDDGTRLIVAPEGLSRFYADTSPARHGATSVVGAAWMTREDREHEIADYVGYLDALGREVLGGIGGPSAVTVLGFSQGVATACRWTVLGDMRPRRLVLWGDLLPPDLPLERARTAWGTTQVVRVRGGVDPIFADPGASRAEDERLRAAEVACETMDFPGGHEIDPGALAELAARP
jgi:predicted esterase